MPGLSSPVRILITGCALFMLFQSFTLLSGVTEWSLTHRLTIALFSFGIAIAAYAGMPIRAGNGWRWTWIGILLTASTVIAWGIYLWRPFTWAAWFGVAGVFVFILDIEPILTPPKNRLGWAIRAGLSLLTGLFTVAAAQIEANFADEEFISALEVIGITLITWIVLSLWNKINKPAGDIEIARHVNGLRLHPGLVTSMLIPVSLIGAAWTIQRYQASFYTSAAPGYPGIDENTPFLCGQVAPDPQSYDGEQVFQEMIDLVASNPNKRVPEFGMLTLGSRDRDEGLQWAEQFRAALLDEAEQGLFTGPANSVKSTQYDAAMRVYYYSRVREEFPDLFSSSEEQQILEWFTRINQRTLQTEWVDWLYALAYSKSPQGPYENQENGAGLLALIEAEGLLPDDSPISRENKAYLNSNRRGWLQRFRNTDDAYVYQMTWITNAYFQSLDHEQTNQQNLANSFEWLLLQAIPDGFPVRYNHPSQSSPAAIEVLGARLLDDGRLIWLAGRAVESLHEQGRSLSAVPGAEILVSVNGESPIEGSCLLFGNTGLPNQQGPLAPDKIILRAGWSPDSLYALLNLRFSGWHRYKATNSLVSIYQAGPLLMEDTSYEPFGWLPVGRSLFRDKRIPRQNLNGLLVGRSGMSAVLYELTGMGSPWAQDPPIYATVADFKTSEQFDYSRTLIESWRGWKQSRRMYLYKDGGPLVVIDAVERIQGQAGSSQAGLAWNLPPSATLPESQREAWRISLREGPLPAELVVLDIGHTLEVNSFQFSDAGQSQIKRHFLTTTGPVLNTAALFLTGDWVGARVALTPDNSILVSQDQTQISIPFQIEP